MELNNTRLPTLLHALIPCVDYPERRMLTLLILMQQLQEIMLTIDDLQSGVLEAIPLTENRGEDAIFHALESVCTKEELRSFKQYRQMFQTFRMMQAAPDGKPEAAASGTAPERKSTSKPPTSPADYFRSMLTPEQQKQVDALMALRRETPT